jgi:EmrB/QacA subfamily drug resistance transporter
MRTDSQHTPDFSNKWKYFAIGATAAFMGTLDASIVNVALPTLANDFNADVKLVAWVVQSYLLTLTALMLIGGRLLDIWGERKLFAIGFALFTIGSLLCTFSVSIYMLIFSRVFQGLGGAVLMSSNMGLIAKAFSPGQRGRVLGIIGTVVSIGLATGPPLGGFLIGTLGWRSIFYINLPIGIAAIIYSLRVLANKPGIGDDHKFDWSGSIFIILGLCSLFLGLNFGLDYGWSDLRVIFAVLFSMIVLFTFLVNEKQVSHPIVNLSLFLNRYFTQSCATSFLAFIGMMSSSILMPFYLQNALGFAPQKVGLFIMAVPASMLLVAPLAGWISDLIGTRIPATAGLGVLSIALYSLASLDLNSSNIDIIWRLCLVGIGMGIFASPNANAILSSVSKRHVGLASGLAALMRTSGITFGIALSVTIFTYFRNQFTGGSIGNDPQMYVTGMQPVFLITAALIGLNMIVSVTRGKRPKIEMN